MRATKAALRVTGLSVLDLEAGRHQRGCRALELRPGDGSGRRDGRAPRHRQRLDARGDGPRLHRRTLRGNLRSRAPIRSHRRSRVSAVLAAEDASRSRRGRARRRSAERRRPHRRALLSFRARRPRRNRRLAAFVAAFPARLRHQGGNPGDERRDEARSPATSACTSAKAASTSPACSRACRRCRCRSNFPTRSASRSSATRATPAAASKRRAPRSIPTFR